MLASVTQRKKGFSRWLQQAILSFLEYEVICRSYSCASIMCSENIITDFDGADYALEGNSTLEKIILNCGHLVPWFPTTLQTLCNLICFKLKQSLSPRILPVPRSTFILASVKFYTNTGHQWCWRVFVKFQKANKQTEKKPLPHSKVKRTFHITTTKKLHVAFC